jgi:hypothetical protein
LDDTTLFVDEKAVPLIQEKLEELRDKNVRGWILCCDCELKRDCELTIYILQVYVRQIG